MQAVKKLISSPEINRHQAGLMGTDFEFSVIGIDAGWAVQRINSAIDEIKRVDKVLSPFGADSQASLINQNAGIAPVKVSGELFRLIQRALAIAEVTNGKFDITYGIPSGYKHVKLDARNCTVFLQEKEMRIYFSGIARGYAADRAKYVMQLEGVCNGVIKAGGSVLAWGLEPMPTEVELPLSGGLNLVNMAAAFVTDSAESICVISPSAELAGALAAPLLQMGAKAGIQLVNGLQQIACAYAHQQQLLAASRLMQTVAVA